MYRAFVQFRRPLTFAASMLLAVAYWHCALEWAAELRHLGGCPIFVAHMSAPSAPRPGCENESGCICRGATVAHALNADLLTLDDVRWQIAFPPAVTCRAAIGDCSGDEWLFEAHR